MESLSVIIIVVIIVMQQIQIWSMGNQIKTLFSAYDMMCEVNEKELTAVKEMLKLVKEESLAAKHLFDMVRQSVADKEDN